MAVLSLKESDDLPRMTKRWWHDRGECPDADKQETTQNARALVELCDWYHLHSDWRARSRTGSRFL